MKIRRATLADEARWDAYVAQHPLATPYHRYAWGTALRAGYGLNTHYYIAEDTEGSVAGILPCARLPSPLGRGRLCALPYCDRGEPLAEDLATATALLDALRRDETGPVELRGTAGADTLSTGVTDPKALPAGQKVRMVRALPDSSDALLASFKSKHRSQINKAKKNGLVADIGNSAGHVQAFYQVFVRNMRELGSPTHSLRWFEAIAAAYGDDCRIGTVAHAGQVIGGGIVLHSGQVAAIPWASTLREHNHLAPNMLLYWALLADAADTGIRHFDFGRSTINEGTYRFKAQWGAQPVPLAWQQNARQAVYPPHTGATAQPHSGSHRPAPLKSLAVAAWQRLPLPVTITLGAQLRPYISL
jgi:FemAB-related protein (PEP-CTERM system-associated)